MRDRRTPAGPEASRELLQQPLLIPARIPFGAKEINTHIIINAMYFPAEFVKMAHHLGADEPVRSCHQQPFHARHGPLAI